MIGRITNECGKSPLTKPLRLTRRFTSNRQIAADRRLSVGLSTPFETFVSGRELAPRAA